MHAIKRGDFFSSFEINFVRYTATSSTGPSSAQVDQDNISDILGSHSFHSCVAAAAFDSGHTIHSGWMHFRAPLDAESLLEVALMTRWVPHNACPPLSTFFGDGFLFNVLMSTEEARVTQMDFLTDELLLFSVMIRSNRDKSMNNRCLFFFRFNTEIVPSVQIYCILQVKFCNNPSFK